MRRAVLAMAVVLSLVPVRVLAQSPVGEIRRLHGSVEIDAFGTGDFLPALVSDTLFEESVIQTDYESWAYVTVDGAEYTVSPSSTTPVRSFLASRRRAQGDGFFTRILKQLTRSLSPPDEDEIIAGGRASQVEGPTTAWVYDIDPNQLFEEALHYIDAGRYESAVESLRLIEFPEDGDFDIEEYYVNLAYALMGLGDFHAAMAASFEYARAQPAPAEVCALTPRLQLLGGVAAYYAGEDRVAGAALEAYLAAVPLGEAAPEAVVARVRLLRQQGAAADADRLLRDARRAQPGVQWDSLLSD